MEQNVRSEQNYSFDEIEIDPRFEICEFEMKLTFAVWIAYALCSIAISFYLGRGDPTQYTYLWGVPSWLALGVWGSTAVFFILIVYICRRVFKDMDISG
jgi:uncharacterized membrane protein YhdT